MNELMKRTFWASNFALKPKKIFRRPVLGCVISFIAYAKHRWLANTMTNKCYSFHAFVIIILVEIIKSISYSQTDITMKDFDCANFQNRLVNILDSKGAYFSNKVIITITIS